MENEIDYNASGDVTSQKKENDTNPSLSSIETEPFKSVDHVEHQITTERHEYHKGTLTSEPAIEQSALGSESEKLETNMLEKEPKSDDYVKTERDSELNGTDGSQTVIDSSTGLDRGDGVHVGQEQVVPSQTLSKDSEEGLQTNGNVRNQKVIPEGDVAIKSITNENVDTFSKETIPEPPSGTDTDAIIQTLKTESVDQAVSCEKAENVCLPMNGSSELNDASDVSLSQSQSQSQSETRVDSQAEPGNDVTDKQKEGENEKEEDEYMDILGNGLLTKKVLEPGDGRETRPQYGEIVTIEAVGHLEDGTTVETGTFTFTVGDGDVIQCWDMVLPLVEMNERCEVFTGFKYAYGSTGKAPDIPKEANMTYRIKLIKKEEPPDLSTLCLEDRMKMGEIKRERGNHLFTRMDYAGAINSYNKAIKILDPENCNEEADLLQILLESRMKCYNNMAACQLKIEAYDAAIKSCECVLKAQSENVKALFRMGKAYAAKQDTKLSIFYLKKALQIEPEAKIIHQELSKLTKKLKKETDTEKDMYRKMLGTTTVPPEKTKQTWLKWSVFTTAVVAAAVSVGLAAYRYTQH